MRKRYDNRGRRDEEEVVRRGEDERKKEGEGRETETDCMRQK